MYHYSATALAVFWPETEHARMVTRWPRLADEIGTTWDEHRRRVERHCALLEDHGLRVEQAAGDVPGFEAFLVSRNVTKPSPSDLREYPDLRARPTTLSLAACADRRLLVRLRPEVQAMLPTARPGHAA